MDTEWLFLALKHWLSEYMRHFKKFKFKFKFIYLYSTFKQPLRQTKVLYRTEN